MKAPTHKIDPQLAKSLLAAYDAKAADTDKLTPKTSSTSPEIRMILILSVFDDRSAKWTYEFLVEQGRHRQEMDPKKRANQIRKVSGWISEVRVKDMKLPPLCKGLLQPPDMAIARKRWDALNPRPSNKRMLSGDWEGTPADYSDLVLSPSRQQEKQKVRASDRADETADEKRIPERVQTKKSPVAGPASSRSTAEKDLRPAEITRMLGKLPIDGNYPDEAVRLMILRHTITMRKKPSEDDIREWYHGIGRTMAEAKIPWHPPAAE